MLPSEFLPSTLLYLKEEWRDKYHSKDVIRKVNTAQK
jgi:hypothetical protein